MSEEWTILSQLCGPVYFQKQGVWLVDIILCFIKFLQLNANRVDPAQTPCSVAFDLGLHITV